MKHLFCMLLVLIMIIPAVCAAALMSEEEAIQIAKEKYPKSAQKMGWPLLDLDAYDTECSQMKNSDGTTTWAVCFLSPEYDVSFAEVEGSVFENPRTASLVWNDPDMYIHKSQIWSRKYGLPGFKSWPLDVQAAFYQELLRVKDDHIAKYGPLEDMFEWQGYLQIISRVHDVPRKGDMQLESALKLAREYLIQNGVTQNELQNLVEYAAFYRDDPQQPEYEIRYFESKADEQPLYSVLIDAVTGVVKEEQEYTLSNLLADLKWK